MFRNILSGDLSFFFSGDFITVFKVVFLWTQILILDYGVKKFVIFNIILMVIPPFKETNHHVACYSI